MTSPRTHAASIDPHPARLALLALAFAFALGGCPATPESVERPASATHCEFDADCNEAGAAACGLIRACVDRRCEDVPTRTVHCP